MSRREQDKLVNVFEVANFQMDRIKPTELVRGVEDVVYLAVGGRRLESAVDLVEDRDVGLCVNDDLSLKVAEIVNFDDAVGVFRVELVKEVFARLGEGAERG